MTMTTAQPVLVTGATGNTGRHVVAGLLAEGVPVRALSRDPGRAGLPEEVEVVRGDVTDPADVSAAAKGASAAYLVWPGTDEAAGGAAEVAAALGEHVRRVVYLSATGAAEGSGGVWGGVERAVRGAVPEWTFLRVTGLAVNALAWTDQVHRGVVRSPFGGASRSLVHELDVAGVAVRALVDEGHAGRAYVVTGPGVISQAEQVRVIGEEIGVPARWEEQPLDEARAELAASLGEDFADQIIAHWTGNIDVPGGTMFGVYGLPFERWLMKGAGGLLRTLYNRRRRQATPSLAC
jgi:uncharacterized protein YbjT (DUF2867 family)